MKVYWLSTKVFGGRFKPTCNPAGVIASSVSPQSNTPTAFAKKWTDDECGLHRLIGIDSRPAAAESATAASHPAKGPRS
jgi:hypothetical protein